MIKVLVLAPNPNDGTSWWRAYGPFQEIVKQFPNEFEFTICDKYRNPKVGWSDIGWYDILFVQRPYKESVIEIVEMAKALGVKVWLDYDDNLVGVPISNPAHQTYADPKVKRDIGKLAHLADAITVTNNELASVFLPVNKKVYVIQNGFSDRMFKTRKNEEKKPSKIIAWRGSQTHDQDLDCFMEPIVKLTKDFPDWKWLFMGRPYFKVCAKIPESRRFYVDPIAIPRYFGWLNALNAEIAIVPLEDNDFNKCKSNVSWQEFTFGGAACVVPEWPHWDVPGATAYRDEQSFYDGVALLINDPFLRKKRVDYSTKDLRNNWQLSRFNKLRRELIQQLVVS